MRRRATAFVGASRPSTAAVLWAAALSAIMLTGCPLMGPLDLRPGPEGEHWLRFVHLSDAHITDTESPARLVTMDAFLSPAWHPQDGHSAQVLDATCRAINRIHYGGFVTDKGPVDFVVVSGDVVDNAQHNELRWFIDTMDGQWVTPDSGDLDAPLRPVAIEDNPGLPFKAAGLAKDIPWYTVMGNHDNLAVGNFAVDRSSADPQDWDAPVSPIVAQFLGLPGLSPPQDGLVPTGNQSLAVVRAGDPEPIDPYTFQLNLDELAPGAVPADSGRHFLSKRLFVAEHFDTASLPAGHGFDYTSTLTGLAHYSVRPERDVPIRLVVLDSTGPEAIPGYTGAAGAISRLEFDGFLKPEFRRAREAGEYVIVVTHHPSEGLTKPTALPCVTPAEFQSYLAAQSNILAHLCGHDHYHEVIIRNGRYPYPEILTGSLIDYPQEGRMLDIYYDEAAETFHIESTFITHADRPTRLSAEAYLRATTDMVVSPDSPEWAEHMYNLDLSDLESYLQQAHDKTKSQPPQDNTLAQYLDGASLPPATAPSPRPPSERTSTIVVCRPAAPGGR